MSVLFVIVFNIPYIIKGVSIDLYHRYILGILNEIGLCCINLKNKGGKLSIINKEGKGCFIK